MKRETKVISLELAKQIDVEHKRLGVVVENQWWWRWNNVYTKWEIAPHKWETKGCEQSYRAYDVAELGEMLPYRFYSLKSRLEYKWNGLGTYRDKDYFQVGDTEVEVRGKLYLWYIKEGGTEHDN